MTHDETQMLKYEGVMLYIGHDGKDFVIRVGEADEPEEDEENA